MATTPCRADSKEALIAVTHCRDSEAGPVFPVPTPPAFPKWPRNLTAAFNTFTLLASISIIGIIAHSLHDYSGTRGIHFGGTTNSWPKDLNLHPAYFILAASALGIAPSIASTAISLRRLRSSTCSTTERIMAIISGVLLVIWIVGDILQSLSEKTPKKDLLSWACRRRESPTNAVVSYTSICDEQRAVKYLAILITIAEMGILVSCFATWYLAGRRSKLIDEPWRIKA